MSLAIFSVLASTLSLAKDQEDVHYIMQNLADEEGFKEMSQSTFFHLASQFELPFEIVDFLDTNFESADFSRDQLLQEMRMIRLKTMDKTKAKKKSSRHRDEERKKVLALKQLQSEGAAKGILHKSHFVAPSNSQTHLVPSNNMAEKEVSEKVNPIVHSLTRSMSEIM